MRISDWSSDVCSSDLQGAGNRARASVAALAPARRTNARRPSARHSARLVRRCRGRCAGSWPTLPAFELCQPGLCPRLAIAPGAQHGPYTLMDFIFHDAFADAELLGDFPLGIAVELSHPHDAPARSEEHTPEL